MKKRITLYVDEHVWRQFRAACVTRGKSASEVIDQYMEDQSIRWGVESGKADIAAGRFITHEEMMASLDDDSVPNVADERGKSPGQTQNTASESQG